MVIYCRVERLLCVSIGAFAAHGLSKVLEPKELAWIETGVKYQIFHTIAIYRLAFCNCAVSHWLPTKWLMLLQGVGRTESFFFSGSLYALALGGRQIPLFG